MFSESSQPPNLNMLQFIVHLNIDTPFIVYILFQGQVYIHNTHTHIDYSSYVISIQILVSCTMYSRESSVVYRFLELVLTEAHRSPEICFRSLVNHSKNEPRAETTFDKL